jgi:hypothetical protein
MAGMSKPIVISIPHQLGAADAKARIDAGFGRLEQQFGAGLAQCTRSGDGDRMTFAAKIMGQAVGGRLDVLADSVRLEVDLPPFLAMIADTLKGRLKKEGTLLLEKK